MTMPYGSAEEPNVTKVEHESVPVHVVSSDAKTGKAIAPEFARWRTFYVGNQASQDLAVPGAKRIANRSLRRHRLHIIVNGSGLNFTPNVTPVPAITTSGTAVQNPNGVPVSVTLAGFTATQVFVNGILVGAGNGTYIVPAYGSISVTFTVVGTTATAAIPTSAPQPTSDGVIVGSREDIAAGANQLNPYIYNVGGYLQIGDNVRWEGQQELWVAYPSSNVLPVFVTVCDEQYASDPDAWREDR
jgi:hypothetical protein